MAKPSKPPARDPKDRGAARQWANDMRRRGEAGELSDDTEYLERKLAEEKRRLERR